MTTEGEKNRRNNINVVVLVAIFGLLGWILLTLSNISADMAVVKVSAQKDNQQIVNSINKLEGKVSGLEIQVNQHITGDRQ